jgi:hypothetical protein
MNTKKKTTPKEESATHARPSMLALVVVVAGAVSSWYWYKPLSNELLSGAESNTSTSTFFSSQQTLIEPNTNQPAGSHSSVVPVYSALPEDLVGDRQVELRPFVPTPQGTLQERLSKEPLPVVPISRPGRSGADSRSLMANSGPEVWTTPTPSTGVAGNSDLSAGALASTANHWDSTSPFGGRQATNTNADTTARGARLIGDRIVAIPVAKTPSDNWPDRAFDPNMKASPKLASDQLPQAPENPPLRMSNPGKIVLAESRVEEKSSVAEKKSIQASWSSVPPSSSGSPIGVKKSGAVIHQPKH